MIKIIKCKNQEEINYQIKRQSKEGFYFVSLQKVIEPLGNRLLSYISNPSSNYDDVKITDNYYECLFRNDT